MFTSSSLRAAIAAVAMLLLLPGPGVTAAAFPPSPSRFDCATEAFAYPERWQAEGATFLGRVVSSRTLAPSFRVVRFAVRHVYAGDIGETVTVRTSCVYTRFRVGERYLVSSAGYRPATGQIGTIGFGSAFSVAWHVADDGSIRLVRYGPDQSLGGPAKPYLTQPDTVRGAAHAVAYGIQRGATCVGGEDNIRARWHMEVDKASGGLQVVVAMDVRPDRTWTIELFQNYERFFHKTSVREDDFEIVRLRPNTAGPDRIGFKARQADGQLCRGVITY